MSSIQFTSVTTDDGQQFLTVLANGRLLPPVDDSHPNFNLIFKLVCEASLGEDVDTDYLVSLFDVAATVASKFERLSDRVTVSNGRVYFDGDEVDNALTKQIVRVLGEGGEDRHYASLVNFFEKVATNPNEHSREQLYNWLDKHDFTITSAGDIVGYKGVAKGAVTGEFLSIHSGTAIVDGEKKSGRIPNKIGSVIEMPRSEVQHDPSVGCHRGLHVGTYGYASTYASGALLEVHVNPRDVVSVPTDCSWQKVRTCRYTVVDTLDAPYTSAILDDGSEDYEDDGTEDSFARDANGTLLDLGDIVVDPDGDTGIIEDIEDGHVTLSYPELADDFREGWDSTSLVKGESEDDEESEWSVGDRGLDWDDDPFTVVEVRSSDGWLKVRWDSSTFGVGGEGAIDPDEEALPIRKA